jgi:hypothetical protein
MLKIKKRKHQEITVRVFTESEAFGREFFDSYESIEECAEAVARLAASSIEETQQDGVARQIGIAVVPKSEYGDPDGFGFGIEDGE